MKTLVIGLTLSGLLLVGCSTGGVGKFYNQGKYFPAERPKESVKLVNSSDLDHDVWEYRREGYKFVGSSDFSGKDEDNSKFIRQAKKVKASLVLVSRRHTGSYSGTHTVVVPENNRTTYVTEGKVNGYGGAANYSQRTTVNSPSYNTYNIPYTEQTYEIHAVFLAK
jgi:hypothetical protein